MPAAVLQATPPQAFALNGTSDSRAITVDNAGARRCLAVCLQGEGDGTAAQAEVTSMTYAGVAMVRYLRQERADWSWTEIWYLKNPAVGTNTLALQLSEADDFVWGTLVAQQVEVVGAAQLRTGTPVSGSGTTTGDRAVSAAAANDLLFDSLCIDSPTHALTLGADQTLRWNLATGGQRGIVSTQPGSAGAVMSQTWTTAAPFTYLATAFIGAADVAPANTEAPQLFEIGPGPELFCTSGSWGGPPPAISYQWNRNGVPIAGATGSNYVVQPGDAGTAINCTVTATNSAGSTGAESPAYNVPGGGTIVVGTSLSQQATVRALVGASLSQPATVRALAGATLGQRAAVRALVASSLTQRAAVRALVGGSLTQAAAVRALVGGSLTQAAAVRALAGASLEQDAIVRQLAGASLPQHAAIRMLVGASLEQRASIALQLVTVGASLLQQASVYQLAGASLEQRATVRALAGASLDQRALVRHLVGAGLVQGAPVRRTVGASLEQAAVVRALIGAGLSQPAAVRVLAGASLLQRAIVGNIGAPDLDGPLTLDALAADLILDALSQQLQLSAIATDLTLDL